MFELSFHLPYYAYRSSQTARIDSRIDATAIPLRKWEDVSFLDWDAQAEPCFLYEAQISCIISCVDQWRYTGYCWVDTYFDNKEDRESAQRYHDHAKMPTGVLLDPFTLGSKMANSPSSDPRLYFLTVLSRRLDQIAQEWERILVKLSRSIQRYREVRHSIHYFILRCLHTSFIIRLTRHSISNRYHSWHPLFPGRLAIPQVRAN
jgi:hypothetical protein